MMTHAPAAEAPSGDLPCIARLVQGGLWQMAKEAWAESPWIREGWDHFTQDYRTHEKGRARPDM
eukprot:2753625-Pyramimonas_sp.AAC.1